MGERWSSDRVRCLGSLLTGLWLAWASGAALGAQPEGAVLFKTQGCPACHGEDGSHPVIPDYPVVAGQNAPYLLRQMLDIRDGRRTNGLSQTMRAAVANVTDDQFAAIAAWLAARW